MVAFLILSTVIVYAFVMKLVLSNVVKGPAQNKKSALYQTNSRILGRSNLVPTESTR